MKHLECSSKEQERPKRRFTIKMTAAILLAAVAPSSVVGYICLQAALAAHKHAAREYYVAVAERVQDHLDHRIDNASALLARTRDIFSNTSITESSAVEIVRALLAESDEVSALGIYDAAGQNIDILSKGASHTLPEQLSEQYLRQLQSYANSQRVIVRPPQALREGSSVGIPLCAIWRATDSHQGKQHAGTQIVSYLIAVLDYEYLSQVVEHISSQMFYGARNRIWLCDSTLHVFASSERDHARTNINMQSYGLFQHTDISSSASYCASTIREYIGSNDVPMLGIALFVPTLQSIIVVEEPQATIYRSLDALRSTALLWIACATLLSGVACIILAQQFSKPIRVLSNAAHMIAHHNFTVVLPRSRNDEFGLLYTTFNTMAAELRTYHALNIARVIAERNKLEAVVREAYDGIILLDPSGTVTLINRTIRTWLALPDTSSEAIHIDTLAESSPILMQIAEAFHRLTISPNVVEHCELSFTPTNELRERTLRGTLLKVIPHVSASALISHELYRSEPPAEYSQPPLEPIAYVLVLRDVSRDVEADKLKTELVAVVAHELRSPLNSIIGLAELIADGIATEQEMIEYGRTITSQGRKLAGIINRVLDISRLELGKTDIRRVPVNLCNVIRAALTTNAPLAAQKSIRIEWNCPEPDVATVHGDPDLLGQVMVNLLSNAIKYSPHGTSVHVHVHREGSSIRVSVRDEGYGISDSSQQKLFTKFFRATDDQRIKRESGTGLGLAFVKQVVEQHGGEVGVDSRLNEGSTFWFRLPV
ncbi:MAG: ATP-binding protein [Bacteroidota bacterium]|nr:ATP-binding protein [Candidatus Kapabacteria bacterium]MDW8218997.1 ATP-binding protein [Bacteroidota bacterium]